LYSSFLIINDSLHRKGDNNRPLNMLTIVSYVE
jgi:hypothetical protein